MSQEKVDRYKEYKQNRKQNLEKEKKTQQRKSLIWKIALGAAALALVVALGITAYNAISESIKARPDYDRNEMVINDVAGILTEDTTEAPTEEATTENTAEETGSSGENETSGASESEAESTQGN